MMGSKMYRGSTQFTGQQCCPARVPGTHTLPLPCGAAFLVEFGASVADELNR
jgi:hypothetical protein